MKYYINENKTTKKIFNLYRQDMVKRKIKHLIIVKKDNNKTISKNIFLSSFKNLIIEEYLYETYMTDMYGTKYKVLKLNEWYAEVEEV